MKARILPMSEWEKLAPSELPVLLQHIRPEDVDVAVVEDEGEVVASLAAIKAMHFEGLWIHSEHRTPGVARALVTAALDAVEAKSSSGWVIGGAADDRMRSLLTRLGGVKLEMDSYVLSLSGR